MDKDQLIATFFDLKSQLNELHPITPYATDRLLDNMLEIVSDLVEMTPKDELCKGSDSLTVAKYYKTIYSNLAHTASEEGRAIHHRYKDAHKPGAVKKRQAELQQALRDLIDQVDMDTISIGKL